MAPCALPRTHLLGLKVPWDILQHLYGLWTTASLHVSCVLKGSGTDLSVYGVMHTALIHISGVLKSLGALIIEKVTDECMFIYRFSGKFFSNFMVISKIFWCSDFLYQTVKKTDYLIPYSVNIFNDAYLCMCGMSRTATEDKS